GLLPLLLLAQIAYGASYPLNIGIMLHDQTKLLPVLSWAAALLCLALNWFWIGTYGMIGAAWATLVSYLAYSGLITLASLRLYPVAYGPVRLALVIGATAIGFAGIGLVQRVLPAANLIQALVGAFVVGGIMLGAAWLLWPDLLRAGRARLLQRGASATGSD
ncbi:MAG: hypothetical protein HC822_09815, partial [Oscillochloris sp.]|nr:hypothetical protein [Oscillochloris sp.]